MMEEKIEELREKYSQALRDGDTDKATEYYWKVQELKDESSSERGEPASEQYRFAELDGVGSELAQELVEEFGTFEELADASKEDLEPISGIGEKKAESLLEQVSS